MTTLTTLTLMRLSQEECREFKAIQGCTVSCRPAWAKVRPCLKLTQTQTHRVKVGEGDHASQPDSHKDLKTV